MQPVAANVTPGADLEGFRSELRRLIGAGVRPENVIWQSSAEPSLFSGTPGSCKPVALPRDAGPLIELAVCHRDPARYALLYALVWRIVEGERALLKIHSDPLVHRLTMMAKAVRRDLHKMHAFLRFRRIDDETGTRFVAWFEPEHHILEEAAKFFVSRFRSLVWSILTPRGSLHWDLEHLTIGPPGRKDQLPPPDAFEAGWNVYFESTFNPARLNLEAMTKEMPRKYWHNMPETALIPQMVRDARSRVVEMLKEDDCVPAKRNPAKAVAAMTAPAVTSLAELNALIAAAEPFVRGGTRAVLGEGPFNPDIAFVGEQPGDREDVDGRPFVGPAGQLLDKAMRDAGIDRAASYVTNAVKHFKFTERGKRRIHEKPATGEIKHYRWWLEQELGFVDPGLVVALGASAALALTGRAVSVTKERGPSQFGPHRGFVTVHPSYLLRILDEDARQAAYAAFVADLRSIKQIATQTRATATARAARVAS